MAKTTDLQRFKQLMEAWLEAETSPAQEQELFSIAERIDMAECDRQTRHDVELIKGLSVYKAEISDESCFDSFVNTLTQTGNQRRNLWTWRQISGIAAAAALIITAGVWMFHTRQTPPVPIPDEPVHHILAQADHKTQEQSISPDTPAALPYQDTPAPQPANEPTDTYKTSSSRPRSSTKAVAPANTTLEAREITDPEEAAAILAQSCLLLNKCVGTAEQESYKAITTVSENIQSSINLII